MSEAITTSIMALISRRILQAEEMLRSVSKQIGPAGPMGEQGIPGPTGKTGAPGTRGPQGFRGLQGDTGPRGERGIQGIDGKDGTNGKDGARGADGVDGVDGAQGEKGDTGPAPKHEWQGTKLRFSRPDGKWGKFVDLKGEKGAGGGTVIVRSGSTSGGLADLLPGNPIVEPTGIAVVQAGNLVNLSWPAFISTIAGAIDMASDYSRRSDFVGETIIYRGEAPPGTDEAATAWRIKRIEFVTGPDGKQDIIEKWASGTSTFDKAWVDRATLSYE